MAPLRGLLSPVERKHSWQVAEGSGDATPSGVQHLRRRALGAPEAVRDAWRRAVVRPLGDAAAVLVLDETGCVTQGRSSAGVARQDSGTAGRIDHCQVGVFGAYASRHGPALLARERYVPAAWTNDRPRCQQAGLPADRGFATTPALATEMRRRTLAAGVPATWVTGDRVYGDDRRLRVWREAQPQAHVLAVSGTEFVWLDGRQRRVNTRLAELPGQDGTRLSAGTPGPRWDDGRWLPLAEPLEPDWRRWRLIRRRVSDPQERHADVVLAPHATPLEAVVQVAGTRWSSEQLCDAAKGDVGLEHDEVRSWTGGYRPIPLALWALSLLSVLGAGAIAVEAVKTRLPPPQRDTRLAAFKASRGRTSR